MLGHAPGVGNAAAPMSRQLCLTLALGLLSGCVEAPDIFEAAKLGDGQRVSECLSAGAKVDQPDTTGATALQWAALGGHDHIVKLLIDAGADVNAKTEHSGETPLYSAARNAAQGASKSYQIYLDLTKMLITKGADVNVKLKSGSMIKDNKPYRAKSGETTLHEVARSYSEKHASEVCELLIANGAKINEGNAKGQTPLDEALANKRTNTAEVLRKHGGKTGEELKAEVRKRKSHEDCGCLPMFSS